MMLSAKLFTCAAAAFLMWACVSTFAASAAVQQCRFVKAKAEREACYAQQEKELAAKRNAKSPKMTDELQRLKSENDRVNDRLKSICRGC
jgi:hypothetical protein